MIFELENKWYVSFIAN